MQMFTRELARRSSIPTLSLDPGTVNTKMLLAGWGACGVDVRTCPLVQKYVPM